MRQAHIFYKDHLAGILTENDAGYEFCYLPMQHIRPVDYQCFINKMVEKSVLHFFFFAERVQN